MDKSTIELAKAIAERSHPNSSTGQWYLRDLIVEMVSHQLEELDNQWRASIRACGGTGEGTPTETCRSLRRRAYSHGHNRTGGQ